MSVTITKNKLNFEDYLHYDDGTDNAYELVDGELILMNPPTGRHALILLFLSQIIEAEIKRLNLDWIALQGIGIRTGVKRSRLPDLSVISREQINQVLDISAVIDSPPYLVIEIVSPESEVRDYRYKRSEYSVVGIPEYWIINPRSQKITILTLVEGMYEAKEYQNEQAIESEIFPDLHIKANEFFII